VREIRVTLQKNEQRSAQSEHRHRQKAISTTDPAYDKKRIEEEKGGLLQGSYRWVLDDDEFKWWRNTECDQLLWIKGGPGKGKTMLSCGIIDELAKEDVDESNIAYVFCQANNSQINSATAVLRGIISMLVKQRSSLIRHIQEELSENENAWVQVRHVFLDILRGYRPGQYLPYH
jgi:Cdc6-like AAA superfamily ATPase